MRQITERKKKNKLYNTWSKLCIIAISRWAFALREFQQFALSSHKLTCFIILHAEREILNKYEIVAIRILLTAGGTISRYIVTHANAKDYKSHTASDAWFDRDRRHPRNRRRGLSIKPAEESNCSGNKMAAIACGEAAETTTTTTTITTTTMNVVA